MFLRIDNTPRDYAWGSATAIAELLGTVPSGRPEAELWLGAHPGSPARIVEGAPDADLAEWAAAHRPEGRLPFLLKVLAAAAPLSLQAHPTLAQAAEGFARERAQGIPIDAAHRNYKDPFHKPELLVAVSDPFRALAGFRPVSASRAELAAMDDPRLAPLVERLTTDTALGAVFTWLIARERGVDGAVAAITEHAQRVGGDAAASEGMRTAAILARHYPGDPGIAISLLMHTVLLAPGEALYLPAGNLHAYVEGLGIELMAASDNVLRGGLTPKHVDVPELMSVLDARPLPVPYLRAEEPAPGIRVFRPDVRDFVLTLVDDAALAGGATVPSEGDAIVLCTSGEVQLTGGPLLRRGEAAYTDETSIGIRGEGLVWVATGA
ncbi:mannose-6-phosphate isomerase, class I [Microcella daejeonensis]|uniref:mannose-6-phosphate isomerase n=1 Tax=Microcella daejeonensis TaxID=2994971 RepID=A0A9E8S9T7_9MICO|nr:mannose-6-phosphate isomerase, class I [Microcella daejeonensis]WAB81861.1 mannose-6-phosphate isomerase, class I [Microcella daejeonensis]